MTLDDQFSIVCGPLDRLHSETWRQNFFALSLYDMSEILSCFREATSHIALVKMLRGLVTRDLLF